MQPVDHNTDDLSEPGDSDELLEELVSAYNDALFEGSSIESIESRVNELDPDSQAKFARAKLALAVLASAQDYINTSHDRILDDLAPLSWAEFGLPSDGNDDNLSLHRLGRFTIERELGRGGLGVVFLAYDPVLQRRVALKVPRPEVLLTPDVRARFDRESQAAARLTHPNLLPVYEVGRAGPVSYLVTAYCAGPNLATWLQEAPDRSARDIRPREAAFLVKQLADAVHYAHTQGVLHRDIKPSNVLLDPAVSSTAIDDAASISQALGWVPKLVDFGLARVEGLTGSETRSGITLGTLGYMSPEQAAGRSSAIGPATDVYGLGTILYELLTGRGPFSGLSEAECLRRMLEDDPPRPRQLVPDVPLDLEAICLHCLEKKSSNRYATAADLSADLQRFIAGEPTVARSLSAMGRALRWARRKPWIAGLGTAAAMLLVLLAAISSFAAWRIAEERDAARNSEQAAIASATAAREALANARLARANETAARKTAEASAAEAHRHSQMAQQEAQRARREAATSGRLSDLLSGVFQSADPTGLGGIGLRRSSDVGRAMSSHDLLRQAVELVLSDSFANEEPIVRARLLARLSKTCRVSGMFEESDRLSADALVALEAAGGEALESDWALAKQARGFCLADALQYQAAEQLLREALEHAERARQQGLADESLVADVKFDLGWCLADQSSQSSDGESLLREVLETRRRLLGDSDPRTANAATAVCIALLAQKDEAQVRQFLLETLVPIYTAQPEGEQFTAATQSLLLGYVARQGHDLERAIAHYRDAIATVEALGKYGHGSVGFSADHPAMMLIWGELAGTYKQNGQYREGEEAFLRVIEISDRVLPNGHLRLTGPLLEYSLELQDRRDFAEQAKFARRALSIYLRYPEISPKTAIAHLLRAKLWLGDEPALSATAEECLTIVRASHGVLPEMTGACLIEVTKALANPLADSPLPDLLPRLTELAEELLAGKTELGSVHREIAMRWFEMGDREQAQAHLDRSLEVNVPAEGPLTPAAIDVLATISRRELDIGSFELARQHALRILAVVSDDHARRSEQYTLLHQLSLATRDPLAASDYCRLAIVELEQHSPVSTVTRSSRYCELGAMQYINGAYKESYSSLRLASDSLLAFQREDAPPLYICSNAIDLARWLRLVATRLPDEQEEIERLASEISSTFVSADDRFETAVIKGDPSYYSRMMRHSSTSAACSPVSYLSIEDQETLERATSELLVTLLRDAIEFSDARGHAFPSWRVRQEYAQDLAYHLFKLKRYSEAEVLLLDIYEQRHEALPARHQFVTGVAEDLARLYTAWNQPAEAEKFRQLAQWRQVADSP